VNILFVSDEPPVRKIRFLNSFSARKICEPSLDVFIAQTKERFRRRIGKIVGKAIVVISFKMVGKAKLSSFLKE